MKVYTKKAAKDYPEHGIKRGDVYYEWCFYRQKPNKSKTYPRESELVSDEDFASALAVFEQFDPNAEVTYDNLQEMISTLTEARDNMESRYDDLNDGLRAGSVGTTLEERKDQISSTIDTLENIISDLDDEDYDGDSFADRVSNAREF